MTPGVQGKGGWGKWVPGEKDKEGVGWGAVRGSRRGKGEGSGGLIKGVFTQHVVYGCETVSCLYRK